MRFSPCVRCLAIAVVFAPAASAVRQDDAYESARMSARRELELAKIEFRDLLASRISAASGGISTRAIELTEAEIRDYKERLRDVSSRSTGSHRQRRFMVTCRTCGCACARQSCGCAICGRSATSGAIPHAAEWRLLELRGPRCATARG